jgi:hypothetical protein
MDGLPISNKIVDVGYKYKIVEPLQPVRKKIKENREAKTLNAGVQQLQTTRKPDN